MNVKALDKITVDVLDEAVDAWHTNGGQIVTTLWAVGAKRSLFAQPVDEIGRAVTPEARSGFQALMALVVRARYIGRADETLVHVRDQASGPRSKTEMENVMDTDPSIHTAIAVESLEVASMTNLLKIARLELDIEGRTTWIRTTHPDPTDMTSPDIRLCGVMINTNASNDEARPLTFDDLDELMRDLNWSVVETDRRVRGHR